MTPLLRELTPREEQVVERIARGFSYDEIGTQLGILPRTVKEHRDNAREKLGASSTPNLIYIYTRAQKAAETPA